MPPHVCFPLMLIRTAGLPAGWLDGLSGQWEEPESALRAATARSEQSRQQLLQALDEDLAQSPEGPARTTAYNARKRIFQGKNLPAARIEQLPENSRAAALEWTSALQQLSAAEKQLDDLYRTTLEANWQAVQSAADKPAIVRSLLFASHDLLAALPGLQRTPVGQWRKKEKQTALALARYLLRASTKTSPFSHLTTVSVHEGETVLPGDARAAVTPNVALLPALYDLLLNEPAFYRSRALRLNPCITRVCPDGYQWLYFDGEQESFQKAGNNGMLNAIVRQALDRQRTLPFSDWLTFLDDTLDASEPEREKVLLELAGLGFLEWVLPETGLSPRWCERLGICLADLPPAPVITAAAALLHDLQSVANALPALPPVEVRRLQEQMQQHLISFFQQNNATAPPIPAEQIFFEDVARQVRPEVPEAVLAQLCDQLADAWAALDSVRLPRAQASLDAFAKTLPERRLGWMAFASRFLEANPEPATAALYGRPWTGAMGALLQVYCEDGHWKAVVNALYPGGGKMLSRWMHLFPPSVQTRLDSWRAGAGLLSFPWQGWHNANFQQAPVAGTIQVPGGRLSGSDDLLAGDLEVDLRAHPPALLHPASGQPVYCTDLGLEAPQTRPPAMRVLGALTLPYVSVNALADSDDHWEIHPEGWRFRPRIASGDLLIARTTWWLEASYWTAWTMQEGAAFFRQVRKTLHDMRVPARFFARFPGEKPQYFDRDSPLSMLLLEKLLRQGGGDLEITEMAPLPEQYVVSSDSGRFAAEWVVEWRYSEG